MASVSDALSAGICWGDLPQAVHGSAREAGYNSSSWARMISEQPIAPSDEDLQPSIESEPEERQPSIESEPACVEARYDAQWSRRRGCGERGHQWRKYDTDENCQIEKSFRQGKPIVLLERTKDGQPHQIVVTLEENAWCRPDMVDSCSGQIRRVPKMRGVPATRVGNEVEWFSFAPDMELPDDFEEVPNLQRYLARMRGERIRSSLFRFGETDQNILNHAFEHSLPIAVLDDQQTIVSLSALTETSLTALRDKGETKTYRIERNRLETTRSASATAAQTVRQLPKMKYAKGLARVQTSALPEVDNSASAHRCTVTFVRHGNSIANTVKDTKKSTLDGKGSEHWQSCCEAVPKCEKNKPCAEHRKYNLPDKFYPGAAGELLGHDGYEPMRDTLLSPMGVMQCIREQYDTEKISEARNKERAVKQAELNALMIKEIMYDKSDSEAGAEIKTESKRLSEELEHLQDPAGWEPHPLDVECVVVSPMSRTIQTACVVFEQLHEDVPFVACPTAAECSSRIGAVLIENEGRPKRVLCGDSEMQTAGDPNLLCLEKFGTIDWTLVEEVEAVKSSGKWWETTDAEHMSRAHRLILWLREFTAKNGYTRIACVSHCNTIKAVFKELNQPKGWAGANPENAKNYPVEI